MLGRAGAALAGESAGAWAAQTGRQTDRSVLLPHSKPWPTSIWSHGTHTLCKQKERHAIHFPIELLKAPPRPTSPSPVPPAPVHKRPGMRGALQSQLPKASPHPTSPRPAPPAPAPGSADGIAGRRSGACRWAATARATWPPAGERRAGRGWAGRAAPCGAQNGRDNDSPPPCDRHLIPCPPALNSPRAPGSPTRPPGCL